MCACDAVGDHFGDSVRDDAVTLTQATCHDSRRSSGWTIGGTGAVAQEVEQELKVRTCSPEMKKGLSMYTRCCAESINCSYASRIVACAHTCTPLVTHFLERTHDPVCTVALRLALGDAKAHLLLLVPATPEAHAAHHVASAGGHGSDRRQVSPSPLTLRRRQRRRGLGRTAPAIARLLRDPGRSDTRMSSPEAQLYPSATLSSQTLADVGLLGRQP
jgi:hypothetical protein